MKTTIELPDSLMRRIKVQAAHRNQKLKDLITQLLEIGMRGMPEGSKVPDLPKPVRLKTGSLTIDHIESAIAADRD